MTDKDITQAAAGLLVGVQKMITTLGDKHLVDPTELRLTVTARAKQAKALIDGGMSQRQAAKALGVSKRTIQNDVDTKYPKSGQKVSTSKPRGTDVKQKASNGGPSRKEIETKIQQSEAKLSTAKVQSYMYDTACRLVAEMTAHTRSRFIQHMEKNYGQAENTSSERGS
jgi:transposase